MNAPAPEHYTTAPQDRIPFPRKMAYGAGALVNNLLAAASGNMMIILNLGLGMNPALVGLLGALPRLTDAITDPLMGYISDNTRSKWGRRRPYIFVGAILAAITFAALWQLPEGKSETFYFWYFLIGSIIFFAGYTVFVTPWVALGYELTPDYHERTRLMAVQNLFGQLAYIVAPYFLLIVQYEPFFGDDMMLGAKTLAAGVGVVTVCLGVLPAIFLRERFDPSKVAKGPSQGIGKAILDFFSGFLATLKVKPFQRLCAATFLVFNGFMLISSFQSYVLIYYVFSGDKMGGAEYLGYTGSVAAVSTFVVIPIVTWVSTKMGKRRAFYFATGVSMVGYGLKWFCYSQELPWLIILPAPLMAFGLGGLFTLMPSMVADVVDLDELETHKRREGMFGSIFWWVVKVGVAGALAAGGFLLNATGFDVDLGGNQTERTLLLMRIFDVLVPIAASAIAIWSIAGYPLTEAKAHEIRAELEARRAVAPSR